MGEVCGVQEVECDAHIGTLWIMMEPLSTGEEDPKMAGHCGGGSVCGSPCWNTSPWGFPDTWTMTLRYRRSCYPKSDVVE